MARFKGFMASVKGEDSNVFVLIILLDSQGSWRRPLGRAQRTQASTHGPAGSQTQPPLANSERAQEPTSRSAPRPGPTPTGAPHPAHVPPTGAPHPGRRRPRRCGVAALEGPGPPRPLPAVNTSGPVSVAHSPAHTAPGSGAGKALCRGRQRVPHSGVPRRVPCSVPAAACTTTVPLT